MINRFALKVAKILQLIKKRRNQKQNPTIKSPLLSLKKNSAGFTLIELTLVIMLFAIMAALSISNISFLQRMIVRGELENLYVTCSVLQRSAMMLGTEQTLRCDQATNSYSYKNSTYKLPKTVCFGTAAGAKGPPSLPDAIIVHPITFKESTIIFYPDGIIQSGTIYLTDSRKTCTYALSCAVSKVSYLRKYQYTNSRWNSLDTITS